MLEKVKEHVDMLLDEMPYPRYATEQEAEMWQKGFKSALTSIKNVMETNDGTTEKRD